MSHNYELKATYRSPNSSQDMTHSITIPATVDTKAKTAALVDLRSKTKDLQAQINTLLTAKMEEDKATTKHDAEEEENYGEEKPEDD